MPEHVLKRYKENVFDENGKKKGYTRIRTNSFIRNTVLHSGQEIKDLFIEENLIHNDFDNLNQLIFDLEEDDRLNHKRTDNRKIYAINTVYMLPKLYDNEILAKICKEISAYFHDVQYFACKFLDGTAWCISFVMLNRYYYPEGKEFPIVNPTNVYRDKNTKKICSPDNPDGILTVKKGEIKGYKENKFSPVIDGTDFTPKTQRKYMNDLKNAYYDILEKIANIQIEEGVSIDRYRQKELSSFSDKKIAKKWNDGIRTMEEKIDETISGLKCCAMFSEKVKVQIDRTVSKYRNILKKGIFSYTNESRRAHTKVFIFSYDEEDGHKHMTGYRDLTGYIAMLVDNLLKDLRRIQEYAYGVFLPFY